MADGFEGRCSVCMARSCSGRHAAENIKSRLDDAIMHGAHADRLRALRDALARAVALEQLATPSLGARVAAKRWPKSFGTPSPRIADMSALDDVLDDLQRKIETSYAEVQRLSAALEASDRRVETREAEIKRLNEGAVALARRISELESATANECSLRVQATDAAYELREAVQEAARLLHDVLYEKGCSADPAVTAWLSLPIVKASEGA